MRSALSALLLAGLLTGCADPPDPGVLRMGLSNPPQNLDPRYATDATSSRVNRLLYRRLVEFDARSRPIPSLATWERTAPDRYRFTLGAEGRTFSDGRRLDAEDVLATYRSVLDPRMGSPHRALLAMVSDIRTLGPDSVEFVLDRPDPLFPAYLAIGILPADLIATGHPFERTPVGSGEFRFVSWPEQGRLVIERVWDRQRFEFVAVPDPNVRVMKLLRGEIDMLQNDLPPELFRLLRSRPDVVVDQTPGTNFAYLGFNLEDPVTGRAEVRRAIAHGIDRQAVIRHVFDGAAREAQAFFPPEHWAGADDLEPYRYDPALAREFLEGAGYGPSHPLQLVLKTSNDPFRVRLATILQAQLAEVGIEAEVRSYDWGTFYDDVKSGRFQMYGLSWVGVKTPDIFRYAFHSASVPPSGANRGRYRNPRFDSVLDQISGIDTIDRQAPLYAELQRILLQDLPYVPLWYEDQVVAARRGLDGYRVAPDGNYDGLKRARRPQPIAETHVAIR